MIGKNPLAGKESLKWSMNTAVLFFALLAIFAAPRVQAADLAILRNGFSIRHDHRVVMGTTTRLFLSTDDVSFTDVPTADISSFEKDLSPPPQVESSAPASAPAHVASSPIKSSSPIKPAIPLNQVVDSASATYHLDPDLVNSVIHAESGFNTRAVSPKGAQGLMQLMPGTANQLGVNNAFDPQDNVTGGSRYLRELLERYNFDLVKALAAYNAGTERVEKYHGVPPFRETRAYVNRIVREYNKKKIAQEAEEKKKQLAAKKAAGRASGQAVRASARASARPSAQAPARTASQTAKSTAPSTPVASSQ
jgi:hypothetical protein